MAAKLAKIIGLQTALATQTCNIIKKADNEHLPIRDASLPATKNNLTKS